VVVVVFAVVACLRLVLAFSVLPDEGGGVDFGFSFFSVGLYFV
jgi:hypothetical protein